MDSSVAFMIELFMFLLPAKITRCGHIYCWTCVLHYLALGEKTWRKCPICYEAVHQKDLKRYINIFALCTLQPFYGGMHLGSEFAVIFDGPFTYKQASSGVAKGEAGGQLSPHLSF